MIESLLVSSLAIAFLHALAPDHWVPFVAIGRAQRWSRGRLSLITFLAGLGHVGSSIALGAIGIILGFTLANLKAVESSRGNIAGLVLVGFGLAYGVWGLKQMKRSHSDFEARRALAVWALVAIFVLGPCEPLIPLMFLGVQYGWTGVWLVSALFGATTILMMLFQSLLAYSGVRLLAAEKLEKWTHATCGLVIAFTGGLVIILGI